MKVLREGLLKLSMSREIMPLLDPFQHPPHLHAETTIFDYVHQKDETVCRLWASSSKIICAPDLIEAGMLTLIFDLTQYALTSLGNP
jgi:hypothetical protein